MLISDEGDGMAGRRRWSTEEILDTAAELLRTSDAESFSVRKLAAVLGTDSSSLYRHFRNKTELLRAVADRILLAAMDGYRPEGDWKQRITALALRVREAFGRHPQLAAVWGRYASGGTGSRLVMEEVLQALRASGLPDAQIPARYHRIAVLIAALIASEAGASTVPRKSVSRAWSYSVWRYWGPTPTTSRPWPTSPATSALSGWTAAPRSKRSSPSNSPTSRPRFA
jgi:AcrR family transcriptional regulator